MLIKVRYPHHCHGSDFLCFLFMNYGWVWESTVKLLQSLNVMFESGKHLVLRNVLGVKCWMRGTTFESGDHLMGLVGCKWSFFTWNSDCFRLALLLRTVWVSACWFSQKLKHCKQQTTKRLVVFFFLGLNRGRKELSYSFHYFASAFCKC